MIARPAAYPVAVMAPRSDSIIGESGKVSCRHVKAVPLDEGENAKAEPGNAGRPGDDAAFGGKRGLERYGHHPWDKPGAQAASEPGGIRDESREIGRRGEKRLGKLAGPRQEDRDADWR